MRPITYLLLYALVGLALLSFVIDLPTIAKMAWHELRHRFVVLGRQLKIKRLEAMLEYQDMVAAHKKLSKAKQSELGHLKMLYKAQFKLIFWGLFWLIPGA